MQLGSKKEQAELASNLQLHLEQNTLPKKDLYVALQFVLLLQDEEQVDLSQLAQQMLAFVYRHMRDLDQKDIALCLRLLPYYPNDK